MPYYPILIAPECEGVTTVFNFAPNNWEEGSKITRFLNVSYSDGDIWHSACLGAVEYGGSVSVTRSIVSTFIGGIDLDTAFYLSLGSDPAWGVSDVLPKSSIPATSVPAWRASLKLVAFNGASSSYQGEISAFPAFGSLLSFGYFLQASPEINNTLLFVNMEKSAKQRKGLMELRDAKFPSKLLAEFEVTNNRVNVMSLDDLGFTNQSLPLLVCRQMSGIPLFFSHTRDFSALSLEHTHPPASTVIHGNRFEAQRVMKKFWFSKGAS